ncbi:MAG: ATP-binding protein, partial [Halorientalis sp.]
LHSDRSAVSTISYARANTENRRLLVNWLSESYDVTIFERSASLDDSFDLLIIDTDTFGAYRDQLIARKERDGEGFLPYLLVSSDDLSRLPHSVWNDVDEVLSAPIKQRKLQTCIEGLLDRRRQFSALKRRNKLIEALHGATQQMDGATDPERVCEIAVNAACDALDLPLTAIWLVDDTGRRLRPMAQTDESSSVFETLPAFTARDDSLAWQAFNENETKVFDRLQGSVPSEDLHNPDTLIQSELIVPLGEHGVLTSGSTVERTFDDNDVYGAELLAANTASALERAERERTLARKTSQLEFFNSVIRHDVLNGMTVIQARADVLVERIEDDRSRQCAQIIQEWSDDIVGVVQRVRSVIDTITGEASVELSPIPLTERLEDELSTIRSAYPSVSVEMETPGDVTVLADSLLGDVLGNVLKNAIEHNDPTDISLSVSVTTDSEFATIRIADTGSGVPDDQKEEIFRRGETGHVKSTGSGFGLFFVDSMITEYGGTVWVEDNEPTGAVFVIELPLSEET